MLTRSPPDKTPPVSPDPAPASAWARARQWFSRLLGRPAPAPVRTAPRRPSALDKAELDIVRRDLTEVLDQHPESRTVMRYVRALEHALGKKGRFALDDLPIDVVRRAMEQLDAFVTDWSPPGLATLRSKAAMAIADRERLEAERHARRQGDAEVEVEEASVTTFMEANEEWERSFTGNTDRAPLDDAPALAEGQGERKPG